jgi:hypothetical protein
VVIDKRVTVVDTNGKGTGVIGDLCGFSSSPDMTYAILLLPDGRFEEHEITLIRVLNEHGNVSVGVKK